MAEGDLATPSAPDTSYVGGGSSFDSQLKSGIKSIEGYTKRADKVIGELKGVRDDAKTRLRDIAAKADTIQFPDLVATPEEPVYKGTDPAAAFGSTAMWLAVFGGMLSKRALTNSLNAAGGVMEAIQKRDADAYERDFKKWQIESKNAERLQQYQIDRHRAIMDNVHKDQSNILAEVQVEARAMGDELVAIHAQQGNVTEILKILDARDRHMSQYGLQMDALARTGELRQSRLALEAAKRSGDPAAITAAERDVGLKEQLLRDSEEARLGVRATSTPAGQQDRFLRFFEGLKKHDPSIDLESAQRLYQETYGVITAEDKAEIARLKAEADQKRAETTANAKVATAQIGAAAKTMAAEIAAGARISAANINAKSRDRVATGFETYFKAHPEDAETPEGFDRASEWVKSMWGVKDRDTLLAIEAARADSRETVERIRGGSRESAATIRGQFQKEIAELRSGNKTEPVFKQKIKQLMDTYGIDEQTATGLTQGTIKLVQDPETKDWFNVDTAKETSKPLQLKGGESGGTTGAGGGAAAAPSGPTQLEQEFAAEMEKRRTVWKETPLGQGGTAFIKNFWSHIPYLGTTAQASTGPAVEAKTFIDAAGTSIVNALQNNPRFAEGERKQIIKMFDNIKSRGWTNPQTVDREAIALDDFLAEKEQRVREEMKIPMLPAKRQESRLALDQVKFVRRLLGVPQHFNSVAEYEMAKGAGQVPVGTVFLIKQSKPNGDFVWQDYTREE